MKKISQWLILFMLVRTVSAAPFAPNTVLTAQALNAAFANASITSGTISGVTISGTPYLTGGAIDGACIGCMTPSSGYFTSLVANNSITAAGTVTGSTFAGAGTYLTGTATSLSIGGTSAYSAGFNGVSMASLGTGLVKNTNGTGVPSIAANSDLPAMSATVGGAVPTPPNNTTTFLRGDGTFAVPPTTSYVLPVATSAVLGGVSPDGTTITNTAGAISVTYGTASNTAAQGNDSRIVGAVQSGGALGTPISGTITNLTGTATGATVGNATSAVTATNVSGGTVSATTGVFSGLLTAQSGVTATGTISATTFSGAGTSLTGTAASLTAGTVTTNANLTGVITSVGNTTSVAAGAIPASAVAGTNTQVQYIDSTGTMGGDAAFTFNDTTKTLSATTFAGAGTSLTGTAASLTAGNATSAVTATNIAGGLGGQIPYQSAVNTTALLANGTVGQVLTSAGTTLAPTWTTPAASGTAQAAGTPTGALNGSNQTYTLPYAPLVSVPIYINGLYANPTIDYTISSATITHLGTALSASDIITYGQYNH